MEFIAMPPQARVSLQRVNRLNVFFFFILYFIQNCPLKKWMNKRFVLVIWIHAGETQLSKCRGNDQSHCGTDVSDQREPPEHPWVFVVQMDHNFRHYHWSQCAFINMNTFGFMPTCTFFKHKKFLKKKKNYNVGNMLITSPCSSSLLCVELQYQPWQAHPRRMGRFPTQKETVKLALPFVT